MKKTLILGPNIGWCIGRGGGSRVTVRMTQALLEHNMHVGLFGLFHFSLGELDRLHNSKLKNESKLVTFSLMKSGDKSMLTHLPFPLTLSFTRLYLRKILNFYKPDLVIFQDDVLRKVIKSERTALYVHFPYAAKLKYGFLLDENTLLKIPFSKVYGPLARNLINYEELDVDVVMANSTVTAHIAKALWNRNDILVLYPPVDTDQFSAASHKSDLVVTISSIQPGKRIETVIEAASLMSPSCRPRFIIIGNLGRDVRYYFKLIRDIRMRHLEKDVKIIVNLSEGVKTEIVNKAKIGLHTMPNEMFGIAVAEAMAAGCVPIVYKSPLNGPWVDIINKGQYGIGYKTAEDIAETIEDLLVNNKKFNQYSAKARERAKEFDTSRFKLRFRKIMEKLIAHGT
jgi:glycosyltransferase involved in cell wall biosynthesis